MTTRITSSGLTEITEKMNMLGRAAKIQDFYPEVVQKFIQLEIKLFDTEGASGGNKWKALDPVYVKEKKRRGASTKILIEWGDLRKSLTQPGGDMVVRVERDRITLGSRVPYAHYHALGKGVPKRPPVQFTPDQIRDLFTAPIIRRIKGLRGYGHRRGE